MQTFKIAGEYEFANCSQLFVVTYIRENAEGLGILGRITSLRGHGDMHALLNSILPVTDALGKTLTWPASFSSKDTTTMWPRRDSPTWMGPYAGQKTPFVAQPEG